MKLQRSTLVLVAIALLLGGVVLVTETRRSSRPTVSQGTAATPLFEFEEADVVELHIETTSQGVSFERDAAGFWQMTVPENHPAEEAAIAFLLSRLTTDGLLNTTVIDAADQAEFGLDVPFATIRLQLQDGTRHQLVLGDADFTGQSTYGLIDPASVPLSATAGEVTAVLVSQDVLSGLDRPLGEWKATLEATTEDETQDAEAAEDAAETPAEGSEPSETEASEDGVEDSDADRPASEIEPSDNESGEETTAEPDSPSSPADAGAGADDSDP